jgi:hypothetical protein
VTDEAWIDTVRLARDMGTVRELFPPWFNELLDLPHPLFEAIRLAFLFLSWEELPDDERPAPRIWLDPKRLKEHFEAVKRKRAREMSGGASDWNRAIEDPVDNEAARGLIVG